MASYRYVAVDGQGIKQRGVLDAEAPRHVREQLRQRQLIPLEVVTDAGIRTKGPRLTPNQCLSFTRQLAALLRGAIPLSEALDIIVRQCDAKSVQTVTAGLALRVREGQSLAEALKGYPLAFPTFFTANVAGAERAGLLDSVLDQLADVLEKEYAAKQKLLLALLYPGILLTAGMGVILFLMAYVVPNMVTALNASGTALPLITRVVMAISHGLRAALPALGAGLALLALAISWTWHDAKGRMWLDEHFLKLPLLGPLIRSNAAARFGHTVSLLYGSGISLVEALNLAREAEPNRALRAKFAAIAEQTRDGAKLYRALEKARCFPLIFYSMVASGEESGKLQDLMSRAADYQDREVGQKIAVMIRLLEPAILLLVGGVVLLVVAAVLMPMMNLNNAIQ